MIKSGMANGYLDPMGWKTYKIIKKKAMEQEFSWSGLLISLSIAFFVVIIAAQGLRFVYNSMDRPSAKDNQYQMEIRNDLGFVAEGNVC